MNELWSGFWQDLTGRIVGPMSLRLLLQPTVATVTAVRAGLKDARAGRPAYLWSMFTNPAHRRELVKDGWKDIAKLFTMAVALDLVYQIFVLRSLHPIQALVVASILALLPYLLLRGPVSRVVRRWSRGAKVE